MDPNNLPKFVYLHKNHKFRLKLGFYAAPSNPNIFSKAIRDELHKLKFTFCSDLNGLIMGFGKISSNELIPADIRHCISVGVNVDVFIFRPPVGSTIEAVVNQTSDNHISCLVHNLFNVSIVRPEHQPFNNWSGSKIKKDDKITVKVLSFDHTKKLPHITGDIVDNKNEFHNSKDNQDNSSLKSVNDNNSKNVMKPKGIEDSDTSSSDSESSNKMDTFSKAHDVFTKTSPLYSGKYINSKDEQVNYPVKSLTSLKSVNNNNSKNIIKEIEKENPDSSSSESECSNEIERTSFSNIHDVFTKTPSSSKDKFKYSKEEQDISPIKSLSSIQSINNNHTKSVMKQVEKEDTDGSSSESESSNEIDHTSFSNICDVFTKPPSSSKEKFKNSKEEQDISPIKSLSSIQSINSNNFKSVMEQVEKEDNGGSSSDFESSNKSKHITFSKTCDVFTKKSPLFQDKYKDSKDECDNSSMKYLSSIKSIGNENSKNDKKDTDSSTSDPESSNETKPIHTLNNRKHINSPLFSSTPNSEHTVNNIGLGRNKLQEQLRKHLAKNKTAKLKSFDSVKVSSKLVKENLSQHHNIEKDHKVDDKEFNIPATLVDNNKNIDSVDKIKLQNNMLSDSGISGDELRQKKFSVDNSITSTSLKSKKNKNSDKITSAILHSFSSDENKCPANVRKKPIVSPKNKDIIVNNKNKIENELLQNQSNIKLSVISNSECSNSDIDDDVKSIIDVGHEINYHKQIKNKVDNMPDSTIGITSIQYESSSDDDIYTKLRQNISKIEDKTIICEQIKNQPFHEMYSSDDTSVSSSKSLQSNTTKINSNNKLESENCNIITDKLLNKKTLNKQNKNQQVNEKSTILQSSKYSNDKSKLLPNISSENNSKIDLIHQILDEDSNSDGDLNIKTLQNNTTNECEIVNKNYTNQIPASSIPLNENTKTLLNKDIMNPFIKFYTKNSSSNSEYDASNLLKSTKTTKDKTKKCEQIKNQPFHEMSSNDDESISSFKLYGTSVSSLKSPQSNKTKINSNNKLESENCNIITDKLLNKKIKNKQNKNQQVNEKSTILQSSKCSNDKSILLSNIMSCENNSKINLIKQILEEDSNSDDDINSKPLKINTTNECEILNKNYTNQIPASSIPLNENTKTLLNKNIMNPFIKFYTKNTSSSSEDNASIFKSTKSTKKSFLKKKIIPTMKKEEDDKNVLINQLLISMKHKEKKPNKKLLTEQINDNVSKSRKSVKIKKLKRDELKVKTKNKKGVLKKIIPVVESKSNEFILSNNQNNSTLLSKTHVSSNNSTDDEIDLIKNMIKSRKLIKEADESESIFKNNVLTKLNKSNLTSEKINKKLKSQKTPTVLTHSTKLKKKRPKENKDILLNCILNSLESSSNSNLPTEKKKKGIDIPVVISSDEFKDNYCEKSLSKSKKKKKDHNLVIKINDEFQEKNPDQPSSKSKKKQKDHDLIIEMNNMLKDKISDQSVSKSKKKQKDHDLIVEMNNMLKDKISDQSVSKSKKKQKDHDLIVKMNNKLKDKISDQSVSKSKKKQKDHNLVTEINDELKDKISDQSVSKSKKKEKNHNLITEINNKLKDKICDQSVSKSKKKKKDHNLVTEMNDELKNKISDQSLVESKKKKRSHNLVIETNDALQDKLSDQSSSKSKKKKKDHNLVIETNDGLIDKNAEKCLLEAKKKKNNKNSGCDLTVKDNQYYISSVMSHNNLTRKDNLPINVTKKKKKKNDSILYNTQPPTIDDILSKFELELEDQNLNSKKKKKKNKDSKVNKELT